MEICQRDLGMKSEKLRKRGNRYDRMRGSKPCEDNGRKKDGRGNKEEEDMKKIKKEKKKEKI